MKDEEKDNRVYFFDEPAVIESMNEGWCIIRSAHDRFEVPGLNNPSLKENDLLWTSFIVNPDKKNTSSVSTCFIASDFNYEKVDSAQVIIPTNTTAFESYLSDDYTAFIHEAVLYKDYLDKLLFFGFRREAFSDNLIFEYEIILNPEIEDSNSYPTLYIRSKKIETNQMNTSAEHKNSRETVFAFDMTAFIDYYKKHISTNDTIGFNLKYKTGVDEEGNDIYREFQSKPIKWKIKN
jgi:hypothetical protein